MAAVGSIVESDQTSRSIRTCSLAWTSSAGGAVSGIPTGVMISGEILRVDFVPGTPAPANLYVATLLDSNGVDLLNGKGTGLLAASATTIAPILGDGTTNARPPCVDETLQLVISAAGATKQGTVVLYYR